MQLASQIKRLYGRSSSRLSRSQHCIRQRIDSAIKISIDRLESRLLLAFTPTPVTTYHNDNQSAGVNHTETLLSPSSVNVNQFAKQFSTPVDGQVYAQPLYVPNVTIPSGPQAGVHNIVYVATEHDTLYAIDSSGGNVLWTRSFTDTSNSFVNRLGASAITTVPAADTGSGDITVEVGITSTPVISQSNGVGFIYVEAKSKQTVGANNDHYVQTLYKVDIQTGAIVGSVIIADTRYNGGNYTHRTTDTGTGTDPYVVGNGYNGEAVNIGGQNRVYFNAMRQMNRPGLVIDHGTLYTFWASHGDNGPYHGWVLAYDPNTLALTGALNTTPNGGLGGIWQGGSPASFDSAGNMFFETGNGSFNASAANFAANYAGKPIDANYGDSFLRVSKDPTTSPTNQNANGWGLKVDDFFSPFNNNALNNADTDLGSGGDVILPDALGSAAHPHLLIGSGKEGKLYLVDRDNMGGFNPNTDNVVQTQGNAISGLLNAPAFLFDNPSPATGSPSGTVYILMGYGGGAKAFKVTNGTFVTTPTSITTNDFGYLPGSPSISADGLTNAILWGINRNTNRLYAYRADNLGVQLWDSSQAANNRDQLGVAVKFSVPTVADGQVFAGTSNSLVVYGPPVPPTAPPSAPSNLTVSAPFYNQVILNWQDNSNNEDTFRIERTTTPANPNSWVEINSTSANTTTFTDTTVQSQTPYTYRVRAFNSYQGGSYSAYVTSNSVTTPAAPPTGTGDGLAANYYNDAGATGSPHLNPPAALTRIDATINFDWGAGSPDPSIPADGFSARWTGNVLAPATASYTFRTTSDDGVRLYIDNNLVIDNFGDHGPTDNLYTITLNANTTHAIKMEYYENGGGAVAKLYWSRPSVAFAPVTFTGGGASASYFIDSTTTGAHLQGNPVLTRVDPVVDHNTIWTNGDPDGNGAALTSEYFSARWTGKVQAQYTGTYTFHTMADDGVRLWVNNQLLVDDWQTQGTTDAYGTIALSGGQKYDIKMEYFQGQGGYYAQLRWSGPGTPDQIIPTSQLYSGVAPAAPTGLVATPASGTQINLTWNDNSSIETGYVVERKDPGGAFVAIATLAPDTKSYIDGSLNPDTQYVYRVKATNFAADSPYSNTQTLTTPIPPNKPTNAHATSNSTNSISLAWTDTSNNEDGFRISRAANGGGFIILAQLPPNTTTYTDTNLTPGTDYEYHVQGYNIAGYNDFTGTQTATLTLAPTSPLATASTTPGQINLTWTAPTYSGIGAFTFNVYRGTSPGGQNATPIATGLTSPDFTDTGLTTGVKYYYKITAVDPGGESARSAETSATTVAASVVTRALFYNNSAFDTASNDDAIANDKSPLLPGQAATFANYTSSVAGINGIIIDIAGLPSAGLVPSDFAFATGNDNTPSGWTTLATAPALTVRPGQGANGSDRIELTWPDNTIQKTWLQIRILANPDTGLTADDVFYFGNAPGETGNSTTDAQVDSQDELAARANRTGFTQAAINNAYDFNRDKHVDTQDELIARSNRTGFFPLKLIDLTPPPPAATPASAIAAPAPAPVPSKSIPAPLPKPATFSTKKLTPTNRALYDLPQPPKRSPAPLKPAKTR